MRLPLGFCKRDRVSGLETEDVRHDEHAQLAEALRDRRGDGLRRLAHHGPLFGGSQGQGRMEFPTVRKMREGNEIPPDVFRYRNIIARGRLRGGHNTPSENRKKCCGHLAIFPADRKSTRLNSSHVRISYAVFCLKKKIKHRRKKNIKMTRPYFSTRQKLNSTRRLYTIFIHTHRRFSPMNIRSVRLHRCPSRITTW